jgi:hypothetical protein
VSYGHFNINEQGVNVTTMTASKWSLTPGRVKLMTDVFKERVSKTDPDAVRIWENIKVIGSELGFESMLTELKKRPRVGLGEPVAAPVQLPLAKEDGLYRNPADGTLYRLSTPEKRNPWEHPTTTVSIFSKKAAQRRLTVHNEAVKGKWERQKAQASRQMLRYTRWDREGQVKVLADWFMSEQDKMDYRYGICLFCYRGLEDERSVRHGYGPVCAAVNGLPWND